MAECVLYAPQVLGLQLENYVESDNAMRKTDWTGVINRQAVLISMVTEHLINPLLDAAEDVPPVLDPLLPPETSGWEALLPSRRTMYQVILPTVAVVSTAVACVAIYVVVTERRSGGRKITLPAVNMRWPQRR